MPGNGLVRQSAKAQSDGEIVTTPDLCPSGVSATADISFALLVSRVAGARPTAPGSDWVLPVAAVMRSHTGLVIDDPSELRAIGTSMPSRSEPSVESGNVALPAAPEYGLTQLVEEGITRVATDMEFGGSAMSTAIHDVIEEHAGRLAHVYRLDEREISSVFHAAFGVLRRELNVGNQRIAAVFGVDLCNAAPRLWVFRTGQPRAELAWLLNAGARM